MSSLNTTILSDSDFEKLYETKDNITGEQKTAVRDYALSKFDDICGTVPPSHSTEEILSEMPTERLESLFWGLTNCYCCWRHLHNAPISLESQENTNVLDVATVDMVRTNNCSCKCRLAKRFLRRAYFSEKHIPTELPLLEV